MGWLADSILRVLRERPGEVVTVPQLVEAIYGKDPGGGPEHADTCIIVTVLKLRRRGEEIETIIGYRLPP